MSIHKQSKFVYILMSIITCLGVNLNFSENIWFSSALLNLSSSQLDVIIFEIIKFVIDEPTTSEDGRVVDENGWNKFQCVPGYRFTVAAYSNAAVRSRLQCLAICLQDNKCRMVNYGKGVCELSSTKYDESVAAASSSLSMYYI